MKEVVWWQDWQINVVRLMVYGIRTLRIVAALLVTLTPFLVFRGAGNSRWVFTRTGSQASIPRVSETTSRRMSLAAGGAMLMVASAFAGWGANLLYYRIWPGSAGYGRGWTVVPFLPLTGIFVLVAGVLWARRFRASIGDGMMALLILELIIYSLVVLFTGFLFVPLVWKFWGAVSLAFAPPWVVGILIGRSTVKNV